MPLREYDALVIGAGHNGLTLAAYLQRSGLSTLVIDSSRQCGGMSRTEEPDLPGFCHNPHANFLNYADIMPMVDDLSLRARGLRTLVPPVQHGIAFSDGRPGIVLYRPDLSERTRAAIGVYADADADVFVNLQRRAQALTPTLRRVIYAPPSRSSLAELLEAITAAYHDLGVLDGLGQRSARSLIDALFSTPELRALMYLLTVEFGVTLDQAGTDVPLLGFVLWMIGRRALPIGGMQAVPGALAAAVSAAGGRLALGRGVADILVADGRAHGVRLTDGEVVGARRVVASTAGLGRTLLELTPPEALTSSARDRTRASSHQLGSTITSQHFSLRTAPRYLSSRAQPDLDRSAHTFIGFESPQDVLEQETAIATGQLPAPGGSVHVNTLFDVSQAPPGMTSAGVNTPFPALDSLNAADRQAIRETYDDALLARWATCAPNMTRDNVLADHFSPFVAHDRQISLTYGAEQYRTEVSGLYVCGASTFPGGGVHGACGYNAYSVMAEDLGLAERSAGQPVLSMPRDE